MNIFLLANIGTFIVLVYSGFLIQRKVYKKPISPVYLTHFILFLVPLVLLILNVVAIYWTFSTLKYVFWIALYLCLYKVGNSLIIPPNRRYKKSFFN